MAGFSTFAFIPHLECHSLKTLRFSMYTDSLHYTVVCEVVLGGTWKCLSKVDHVCVCVWRLLCRGKASFIVVPCPFSSCTEEEFDMVTMKAKQLHPKRRLHVPVTPEVTASCNTTANSYSSHVNSNSSYASSTFTKKPPVASLPSSRFLSPVPNPIPSLSGMGLDSDDDDWKTCHKPWEKEAKQPQSKLHVSPCGCPKFGRQWVCFESHHSTEGIPAHAHVYVAVYICGERYVIKHSSIPYS